MSSELADDDRDFLDDILTLMEDPDDGWYEEIEGGVTFLVHSPSGIQLHDGPRGRVIVRIKTRKRHGESSRVSFQQWEPSGWGVRGFARRRELRKATARLRRHLLHAPIREALDGDLDLLDD